MKRGSHLQLLLCLQRAIQELQLMTDLVYTRNRGSAIRNAARTFQVNRIYWYETQTPETNETWTYRLSPNV